MMVTQLLERQVPAGVWHSHQVLDPGEMFGEIERLGIGRIEHGPTALET